MDANGPSPLKRTDIYLIECGDQTLQNSVPNHGLSMEN
jgi:hypothetical protein